MPGFTYSLQHTVAHNQHGDVLIPDQVVMRQSLWDAAGMPCPAIRADGKVVQIMLCDTDA